MINKEERTVRAFYNTIGWQIAKDGVTEDANRWEDLREAASYYVSKTRLRLLRHIPSEGGNFLDMASGPIQYTEYLKYSENFNKRYCIDFSALALSEAKAKIGNHGVFLEGNFLDINLEENLFDCTISIHTIYHIDKDLQEKAVRKLLYLTKPGKPVLIVYSNPLTLISLPIRLIRRFKKLLSEKTFALAPEPNSELYFYRHANEWWNKFNDISSVEIYPWRAFAANFTKVFIPNNCFGKKIFDLIFYLEDTFPSFFVKYFQYQLIILTKRDAVRL